MLENKCLLEVKGAEDKKTARPGVVYLALSDHHLLVKSNGDLTLSSEEAVNYSRRQKRNAFNRRRWSRLGRRSKGFGTRT